MQEKFSCRAQTICHKDKRSPVEEFVFMQKTWQEKRDATRGVGLAASELP